MPVFSPQPSLATYTAADVAYVRKGDSRGFQLRMRDGAGAFSPYYGEMAATADVTFASMPLRGLRAIFSFYVDADIPDGTAIDWQLSRDGTNWPTWNGAAWAAAGSTYNTLDEVRTNIGTLLGSASSSATLRARARLSSDADTQKITPILRSCAFVVELEQRIIDSAAESFRAYLVSSLRMRSSIIQKHVATGATYTLDTRFDLDSVSRTHNLTTDSGRLVNLYSSKAAKVVTMTGSQTVAAHLETIYVGSVPATAKRPNDGPNIRIGVSEDDIFTSEMPGVGVLFNAAERDAALSTGRGPTEFNVSTLKARTRRAREVKNITANVYLMTAGPNAEMDAAALAAGLNSILGQPDSWF